MNKCFCLRRVFNCQKKRIEVRKEKLFALGVDRIEHALDIRYLLRTQVENKMLLQFLFSEPQKTAFRLSRIKALHLEDISPEESESERASEKIDRGGTGVKVDVENVARVMMNWEVKSLLDRNLVIAMLQDQPILKGHKPIPPPLLQRENTIVRRLQNSLDQSSYT